MRPLRGYGARHAIIQCFRCARNAPGQATQETSACLRTMVARVRGGRRAAVAPEEVVAATVGDRPVVAARGAVVALAAPAAPSAGAQADGRAGWARFPTSIRSSHGYRPTFARFWAGAAQADASPAGAGWRSSRLRSWHYGLPAAFTVCNRTNSAWCFASAPTMHARSPA